MALPGLPSTPFTEEGGGGGSGGSTPPVFVAVAVVVVVSSGDRAVASSFLFPSRILPNHLLPPLPELPLPLLEPDDNNPDVVSKKNMEDHAYDALHYGLRSRPITAVEFVQQRKFRQQHEPMMVDSVFGY